MLTLDRKTKTSRKTKEPNHLAEEKRIATPEQQSLMREMLLIWLDFERQLSQVPIVRQLELGKLSLASYRTLLRNLRPQVVEGSRWITRAASSFEASHAELRSKIIHHAWQEHRDYEMLERDYVAAGGERAEIVNAPKNIGSEALSAYMFNQASQPNPVDLLGAMFIIEGLGNKMAGKWAGAIQESLQLPDKALSFLKYHGLADEGHIGELEEIMLMPVVNSESAARILKTARVVARLYLLQLEEIDHV